MSPNSNFPRRLLVYVLVVLVVLGSTFGLVAGTVGFNDWVSYLILGIVVFLLLALVVGNEIYIAFLRRKSKK